MFQRMNVGRDGLRDLVPAFCPCGGEAGPNLTPRITMKLNGLAACVRREQPMQPADALSAVPGRSTDIFKHENVGLESLDKLRNHFE